MNQKGSKNRKESIGPRWSREIEGVESKNVIDIYETNPEYIDHLLQYEEYNDDGIYLEPCYGINKFLYNKLRSLYSNVEGFDILDETGDFLTYSGKCDYIITNPPFNLNLEFITKAFDVARKKISFITPLNYLDTMKRFHIFHNTEFPIKSVLVYSKRISFIKGGGIPEKCITGMSFCWVTWEKGYIGDPIIKWIKNWED